MVQDFRQVNHLQVIKLLRKVLTKESQKGGGGDGEEVLQSEMIKKIRYLNHVERSRSRKRRAWRVQRVVEPYHRSPSRCHEYRCVGHGRSVNGVKCLTEHKAISSIHPSHQGR